MMDATQTTFQKYPAYKDSGVEWLGEIPLAQPLHHQNIKKTNRRQPGCFISSPPALCWCPT